MNLLVTGGAGFIGSHFVEKMIHETDISRIVVLDNFTYAGNLKNLANVLNNPKLSVIKADINDVSKYRNQIGEIDMLLNFAAESHVDRSIINSEDFIRTNIVGTHNLLEYALETNIKKFLQISTDEVYGSIEFGSWDEFQPLRPNSPYSASKASADLMTMAFHKTHGLNINITRCSNNFGERQYPEKLIPLVIKKIISGEQIPIYGDGSNIRDWIHVSDHCEAIKRVLFGGTNGEIYNIGGNFEITNLEIVQKILFIMGVDSEKIKFVDNRKGHDYRYSVNSNKIYEELGFRPEKKLDLMLPETINWYLNNTNWQEAL